MTINKHIIFIFLMINGFNIYCQNKVFKNDTLIFNKFSFDFFDGPTLKDTLPDGEYFVYDLYREDSSLCCDEIDIILKGNYKDSLKTGKFEYFDYYTSFWKTTKYLYKVENYKEGVKEGYFATYNWKNEVIREGTYKNGYEDGLFLYYNSNKIFRVNFYRYGFLIFESKSFDFTNNILENDYWKLIVSNDTLTEFEYTMSFPEANLNINQNNDNFNNAIKKAKVIYYSTGEVVISSKITNLSDTINETIRKKWYVIRNQLMFDDKQFLIFPSVSYFIWRKPFFINEENDSKKKK